jgi:predicted acetyltransferase
MSDNARTLRADIADQHEDAARQARGDLIRDPGYWRAIDDELIAREDLRRELAADAAQDAREARWDS